MKRTIAVIIFLAVSGASFAGGMLRGAASPGFFSKQTVGVKHQDRYVKGELLVTFRKGTAMSARRSVVSQLSGSILKNSPAGFSRVKLSEGKDVP